MTVPAGGVPSINADIDKCVPMTRAGRTDAWTALDKLTEEIVPQVGLLDATSLELVGPAVTQYDYDQFGLEPSLARLAVDPAQTDREEERTTDRRTQAEVAPTPWPGSSTKRR